MPTTKSLKSYWNLSMQQKFLSRFSQLLENGFSIADALAIMKTLFKKQAVDPMIIACLQGQNFADTLEECHFEHRIIYMIRSSEQAGALLQGLQKAADYSDFHLKNRSDLSKKIRYPLTLFGLMSLILIAVFILFMPKIQSFYDSFNLSGNTDFLQTIFIIIGCLIGVIALLTILMTLILKWQSIPFQAHVKQWLFKLPLLRSLMQKIFSYYFSSQWLIFLTCGLSLKESLEMMLKFETIPFIKLIIKEFNQTLEAGTPLELAFHQSPYFTPYFRLTMAHALTLGSIQAELAYYSHSEFKQLSALLSQSFKILQFSLLMLIGIIIILIYLSILQPVFQMIDII